MDITWHSVDFLTGERGPQLQVREQGKLMKVIGIPTDATVAVRCAHDGVALPGWDEATAPGRCLLIAVDKASDAIVWGGLVRRRGSNMGPWVEVSLDTVEAYLFRRYINTLVTWTDADPAQCAIDALAQVTGLPPLTVSATMTGNAVIDGYYDITDNKRIGDILNDLSGLSTGIEWTIDLEWIDAAHTLVRYVVRIAPRLGTPAGVAATQWTMPGCVKDFSYIEDFGEETGANDVLALSSGEGESKPRSTRYEDTALLDSFARFERRFTPATSITSTSTLDQYAEAEIAKNRLGLTQLTITANLDAAPRINQDWWVGDDIDVAITCDRFPPKLDANAFWTPSFTRRLRPVGYEIDLEARTIVPRIRDAA